MSPKHHPAASTSGKLAAVLLLVVAAFQAALAAGAPFGEAAYGGAHPGVLSDEFRVSSGVAVIVYGLLAIVAGTDKTGAAFRRRVLFAATALMVVGAVMNLASPSFVERMLWAPVTIVLVISLWRAARHESLSNASQDRVATKSVPDLEPAI